MNLNGTVDGQEEENRRGRDDTVALKSVTLCNDGDITEGPREEWEANKVAAL